MVEDKIESIAKSFALFLAKEGKYKLFVDELITNGIYNNISAYVAAYSKEYVDYSYLVDYAFSSDNKLNWRYISNLWKHHVKRHKKIFVPPTKNCRSIW